jgi:hypothetical protein
MPKHMHMHMDREGDASCDPCSLDEAGDTLPLERISALIHKHIRTAARKSAKSC